MQAMQPSQRELMQVLGYASRKYKSLCYKSYFSYRMQFQGYAEEPVKEL